MAEPQSSRAHPTISLTKALILVCLVLSACVDWVDLGGNRSGGARVYDASAHDCRIVVGKASMVTIDHDRDFFVLMSSDKAFIDTDAKGFAAATIGKPTCGPWKKDPPKESNAVPPAKANP